MSLLLFYLLFAQVSVICYATFIFHPFDLLMVRGDTNETINYERIGMCIKHNQDCTEVTLLSMRLKDDDPIIGCKHGYSRNTFPNHLLRPFIVNKTRQSLTKKNRKDIESVLFALSSTREWRGSMDDVPLLCFGIIAYDLGVHGFFYAMNHLLEIHALRTPNYTNQSQAFLNEFYYRHLRCKNRCVVNMHVQKDDLVKVKALKQQKNESLQARVMHFNRSFGRIITSRKNKRTQTEFAIQSLFDKEMKLALRPKYLFKITKIYVHRLEEETDDYPIALFKELILSLSSNEKNEILYLPHKLIGNLALNSFDEHAIFMHQQRKHKAFIFDVGVSSFSQLWHQSANKDDIVRQILALPFFTTHDMWHRLIFQMKMGSNPTKMIKKINAIFESINAKFTNIDLNKRDIDLGKLMQKWIAKIENDLKTFFRSQQQAFDNLFIAIKEEMMSSIKELHPNYMKQYAVDERTNITFYKRLQNLYRIQWWLSSNPFFRNENLIF